MTFPIVAIGASAGGLEAISELFGALPAQTGMAYVAVQHLNPDHESLLSEILAKKTALPVQQIQEDLVVAPNNIYLIAPNTTITLVDDMIRVGPRASGVHHPADILFASVARARGEFAIGVVLSGGDGDGALGIQAIKQAGGVTFAQALETARFPSMPKASIDTGCVDFVRRPNEIAHELVRLTQHFSARDAGSDPTKDSRETASDSKEASLRRIFRRLRSAHGVDFTHYKRSTLRRRLDRRMSFKKMDDFDEYAALLESDAAETAALYQDFLIRVTGFFRDPESFEILALRVFPSVCESRSPKAPLRIWVPGCASGEEVYSVAIALMEYVADRPAPAGIQIFGTDVSEAALDKARSGIYLENISEEMSKERLARFFVKQDGHFRISKSIRDLCVFARHDITRDPPFSKLDLVSCRNLLIYLDSTAQRRVMESFHYALWPKGFLLLGPSETVSASGHLFQIADPHHRLYSPNAPAPGTDGHRHALPSSSYSRPDTEPTIADPAVLESDLAQREADRLLLARFAPASVVVDDGLNILQFRGETAPYLEHASGPSSLNLQRVVRSELLVEIAPAIQKARETGIEVRCPSVRLDERPEVSMEVLPLRLSSANRSYLILFESASRGNAARRAQQTARLLPESEKDRRVVQLEHELASLRDYIQATMEEHEASQEELKSAHEEALSASEEFQSTNEELETAKEELQSTNEELTTTNEELRQRNRDLGVLNATLEGTRQIAEQAQSAADLVVESVRESLLVLDDKLHVTRANKAYYMDFDARPGDTVGKLLYHIGEGQWNVAALRERLLDVLARGETLEDFELSRTFPRIGPRTMSLNARRMAGDTKRPSLILLAIADVTARNDRATRLSQDAARKDEFLAMLAHELRNPLAPIATAVKMLRGDGEQPQASGLHDMIDRQTRRLSRLVDELLDLGRFNRGLIEVNREPVNFSVIVEQTVDSIKPQLMARQHGLTVALPDEPVYVHGDAVRLEQVIANLLDNAAKYTKSGGLISVALRNVANEAELSIRDNGIGLSADSLEEIFRLFTQVNRPTASADGGLGIGLTLVRRIVELHGGRVEARSPGLGQGSEFIVRLPSIAESAPAAGTAKAESVMPVARKILIVDDNEDARQSLVLLARSWGHQVAGAVDGPSAIALAEQFEPETMLVDIGMPGMNGYQLARHLRALPRYVDLQLVAMTGFGREEDRQAALAAGFNTHLVKPVDLDLLETLLATSNFKSSSG